MKSTVGRLYVAALAVLIFFVMWAAISAHPWASAATVDPRVADLQAREHSVRVEVARAQAAVTQKWANYNAELKRRKVAIVRANKKRAAAIARAHSIALSRVSNTRSVSHGEKRTLCSGRASRIGAPISSQTVTN